MGKIVIIKIVPFQARHSVPRDFLSVDFNETFQLLFSSPEEGHIIPKSRLLFTRVTAVCRF